MASSGSTSTAGGAGTGGSGQGPLSIQLTASTLYVNCQPLVSQDPIYGDFTAQYTNDGTSPASAAIVAASLSMVSGAKTLVWPLAVTPSGSGLVAPTATVSITHEKQTQTTGLPAGMPCDFCGGTWTLSVTWDMGGGARVTRSLPSSPVACVF
jgi:hypothetical protein